MKIDQEYEVVRIDGDNDPLKEHPQNPKKGDVELIDESIDINGWYGAVTAQKSTGYILAGNHRYRVAKKKGAVEIPVIWRDCDDETALKILLVDNKSADAGEYDEQMLEDLLASLDTLDGTGYNLASAQERIEEAAAPKPPTAVADPPDADDVPEDVYKPEYGVMVVCESEEQQQFVYNALKKTLPEGIKLQVVAV